MSTHVFKISQSCNKTWEIKLCISVNIYRKLPKLGMGTHFSKLTYAIITYAIISWEIKFYLS